MTRMMKATLLAIAGFFLAVALSFIWFVATWDPEREQSVTQRIPHAAPLPSSL